jgi:comEA protein
MRRFVWGAVVMTWALASAPPSALLADGSRQAQNQSAAKPGSPPSARPTSALVDLNRATSADLQRLPGIGPRLAERILEYRQKSGGFKKIEELMNVRGIGEKNFLKLKPLITVTPVQTPRPGAVR